MSRRLQKKVNSPPEAIKECFLMGAICIQISSFPEDYLGPEYAMSVGAALREIESYYRNIVSGLTPSDKKIYQLLCNRRKLQSKL